jgi:hypothetical protein
MGIGSGADMHGYYSSSSSTRGSGGSGLAPIKGQSFVATPKPGITAHSSHGGGTVSHAASSASSNSSCKRGVRFNSQLESHQAFPGPGGSVKTMAAVQLRIASENMPQGILKGSRQKREIQRAQEASRSLEQQAGGGGGDSVSNNGASGRGSRTSPNSSPSSDKEYKDREGGGSTGITASPKTVLVLNTASSTSTSTITSIANSSAGAGAGADTGTGLTVSGAARAVRPSLTDQLAAIGDSAQSLTNSIKSQAYARVPAAPTVTDVHARLQVEQPTNDTLMFTLPAKAFKVGSLECRYPSPVHFYESHMEYVFNHPQETTEVAMTMHYKDLSDPSVTSAVGGPHGGTFRLKFRVPKQLIVFNKSYDHTNPSHR